MRYLSSEEYDGVLLLALRRLNIAERDARKLIDARWPQCPPTVVVEATGRGLTITLDDVLAYLEAAIGDKAGETFALGPQATEDCLRWCVEQERAKPNTVGGLMQRDSRPVNRILQEAHAAQN